MAGNPYTSDVCVAQVVCGFPRVRGLNMRNHVTLWAYPLFNAGDTRLDTIQAVDDLLSTLEWGRARGDRWVRIRESVPMQ